jgi:hypothetical protein
VRGHLGLDDTRTVFPGFSGPAALGFLQAPFSSG